MATRKRNEYLEAGNSDDDEDRGYDSEQEQLGRSGALAARSIKRRRVDREDKSDDDSESAQSSDIESEDVLVKSAARRKPTKEEDGRSSDAEDDLEGVSEADMAHDDDDDDEDDEGAHDNATATASEPAIKQLTAKQLLKSQKAAKKTGVIYLSRIPPFMKPATLKHFLAPHGELGRVFLTPEDATEHTRRVRAGGNKKKSFTDGWVEFLSKKKAKLAAETLNGNIIGGRKGNFYHDDIWNIKYLKGFKWQHLTEQIANENAERAARLRTEITKTRRENKKFVEDIERSKMLEGMQAKQKAKMERSVADGDGTAGQVVTKPVKERLDLRQQFKQNQAKLKTAKDGAKVERPEAVTKTLSKIF